MEEHTERESRLRVGRVVAHRSAAVLAVAFALGCNPEYTRWIPREEDLEILYQSSRGNDEVGTEPAAAEPPAPDRSTPQDAQSRPAQTQQMMVQKAYRTHADQVQRVMESLGKPAPSLRAQPGASALEDYKKLASDFTKLAWKGDPSAVYDSFKIKGVHADPDLNEPNPERDAITAINLVKLNAMYRDEFEEIDAAKHNSYSKRIGLSLSGGGIRSASFATGVLQGLKEIGVLGDCGYLSTVSGGGYAGAWYVMQGPPNKTLAPGSPDLQHLAQNGNYLVAANYSKSTSELLSKFGLHTAITPVHWLINGLLDLDFNWYMFRQYYKSGLAQAFLYETPCSGNGDTVFDDDGSMGFLNPLTKPNKPFWIINMHLALGDDPTPRHRNRSGDAFELTPLRAGSDAVGYIEVPCIDCKRCFQVAAALGLARNRSVSGLSESERRQTDLEARLVKAFHENLASTFAKRLRSGLARTIVSSRFIREILDSVRGAERRAPRASVKDRSLTDEIQKFRRPIEESFQEKLKAKLDSKAFKDWIPGVLQRLKIAPPEADVLLAALTSAAADGCLSESVLDAFEFLSTKDDRREAFQEARARLASDRRLQVKIREGILTSVIDKEFDDVLEKVLERLQEDWEVRKVFNRILKALLPLESLCLRIEDRTRQLLKDEALSPQAMEVIKILLGDAPRQGSIHWYKLLRANRECLTKAFPGAFEADNLVDWMSPGYGIAMSGAAVDAQSLKQGFLVSSLTQALNYDLGYFVDGWSYGWVGGDASAPWWHRTLFYLTSPLPIYKFAALLTPGAAFDFGSSWHENTQWAKRYYLTDGGHFENLGVYALVRRGCRLIILSDGDTDPKVNDWDNANNATRAAGFADLRELEMKLAADFGAELEIKWEDFRVSSAEPMEPEFGDQPLHAVFTGEIRNLPAVMPEDASALPVKIIVVKAAYDFESRLRTSATFIDAEKLETPDFPHETLAQQLYSELKVTAYRALGRELVVHNKMLITSARDTVKQNSVNPKLEKKPCP